MKNSFQLKKRGVYSELPLQLLSTGITRVKSLLLELHPEEEFTVNKKFLNLVLAIKVLSKRQFVTVECLPKSKWTILSDKRIFSNPDILMQSWLQMSVLGLTGKGKALKPFWNQRCLEASKKLWLPTEIDSAALHLSSSNSSSKCTKLNSLFSTIKIKNPRRLNSQTTSCPLYTSTVADKWDAEDTLKRARKIRLYPTKKQSKKLKQWSGTARYVYNNALNGIKNNNEDINAYSLRDKYVSKTFNEPFGLYELFYNQKFNYVPKDWELETPKDIRAGAIRDLCKAYKTCFSNLKQGNITKFGVNFRSKRNPASIEIPKSAIKVKGNKISIFPRFFNSGIRKSRDHVPDGTPSSDCRLVFERNRWYLVTLIDIKKKPRHNNKSTAAIDPGVRKFVVVYSDKEILSVSLRKELLKKMQLKLDLLQSLRSKKMIPNVTYKRGINKIYTKLDNLIDETHNQVANDLTLEHSKIYIPIFESQKMGKKSGNLRKCTRRNLFQMKHFKFRTKLETKCEERNVEFVLCTEEYTSRTCTGCGHLGPKSGSESLTCSSCNLTLDRDIKGARNILLKNGTQT